MKVKLTPEAINDIAEIKSYIREEFGNSIAANRAAINIAKSYKQLKAMPYMGVALRSKVNIDTPYRLIVSGNYLVFYEVNKNDNLIDVIRIIHSKRNYTKILFPNYDNEDDDADG